MSALTHRGMINYRGEDRPMASKKNTTGHGLTVKQEAFCQAYVKGDSKGSASEAYRIAYEADGMKDSSIRVEACRLLDNPKVTQRIDELNGDIVAQNRLQGVSLRQRVQDGLLAEAMTAESPAARVRAWELIGKLQGVDAFGADKVEQTTTVTSKQAESELQQAILDALQDDNVVQLFEK
jgi:phage terminase small subunit